MKFSLACVLLTAATALANPTPAEQGEKPKKQLPPGWEYTEDTRDANIDRINLPPVNLQPQIRDPSPCIARCLRSKFRDAGCGHAKDWECLCRNDGLAPEILNCVARFCHSEQDNGSIRVQNDLCTETVRAYTGRRPPSPPKRKGN